MPTHPHNYWRVSSFWKLSSDLGLHTFTESCKLVANNWVTIVRFVCSKVSSGTVSASSLRGLISPVQLPIEVPPSLPDCPSR